MTPYEIAIFKRFLSDNGMGQAYRGLYRTQRWKQNPKSIELFFALVEPSEACMNAFYFTPNATWGVDYWTDMQNCFNVTLSMRWSEEKEKNWYKFKHECNVLKKNWDSDKGEWNETKDTAFKRITSMQEEAKQIKAGITLVKESIKKEEEKPTMIVNDDPLAKLGFKEVDINKTLSSRLNEGHASINVRTGSNKITINNVDSDKILKSGTFRHVSLMSNDKGEVLLVFNSFEKGIALTKTKLTSGSKALVTVNSTSLLKKVRGVLGINEDYVIANLEEVANTSDYIAFKLYV